MKQFGIVIIGICIVFGIFYLNFKISEKFVEWKVKEALENIPHGKIDIKTLLKDMEGLHGKHYKN